MLHQLTDLVVLGAVVSAVVLKRLVDLVLIRYGVVDQQLELLDGKGHLGEMGQLQQV